MLSDERNAKIDLHETLELDGLLELERRTPRDVDLLVAIGRHYFKQRDLKQCHAYYSKALDVDPDEGWTHLYMGNLCFAISCYDQAERYFKRAAELLPGNSCPLWCLGDVYAKQGYWSRTEQLYRRAVETDPRDETAEKRLEAWLAERRLA